MNRPTFSVLNAVLFQALWWSAALWRDQALWLMVALLLLHWFLSPERARDARLLLLALVGWGVDGLLVWAKVLHFTSALVLPLWLLCLWVGLVWCLVYSLAWLMRLPLALQSLIGAITGSVSYFAAAQLGALTLQGSGYQSLGILVGVWALLLPLLVFLTRYIQRGFTNEH